MKYKNGDKVRIISNTGAARPFIAPIGTETFIVDDQLAGETWPYNVSGNGVDWCAVRESNIELVNDISNVIEVGDTITGSIKGRVYTVDKIDNVVYWCSFTNEYQEKITEYTVDKGKATLLAKASKGEVIGYELLKDLPGIPAGSKSAKMSKDTAMFYYPTSGAGNVEIKLSVVQADTTWFKPIYKPTEVKVSISKGRTVVIKDNEAHIKDVGALSKEAVGTLYGSLKQTSNVGGHKVSVKDATYQVGCQEFTKADIELVYKELSK